MNNIFLDALPSEDISKREATKINISKLDRIIDDLSNIYKINKKANTAPNGQWKQYYISNSNYISRCIFTANSEGVLFRYNAVLGYYFRTDGKFSLGELYERYKSEGTKPHRGGDFKKGDMSPIDFQFHLNENSLDFKQRLRDVMHLFEFENIPSNI